jgi:hypothetical protein
MSQKSILDTVQKIVEKSKRAHDGPAYEADQAYLHLIDALRNILSTGEALPDTKKIVVEAIDELLYYTKLGIFVNNSFSPLSPSMCARANLRKGSFISGKRFVVMDEETFNSNSDAQFPEHTYYAYKTYMHGSYFYRLNPQFTDRLSEEQVEEFGLAEAILDHNINQLE